MAHLPPSAPSPLFDRLCAPAATGDGTLDARGLQASLQGELQALLGTRSRLPMSRFAEEARSVIDWGLPDFSGLSVQSGDDREVLRQAVRHAISCFEPRLRHVEVGVDAWPGEPQRARVSIAAAVRIGQTLSRVQFTLALGATEGSP